MFQCSNVQMLQSFDTITPSVMHKLGLQLRYYGLHDIDQLQPGRLLLYLVIGIGVTMTKKHILDVVTTILVLHNYITANSKSTVLAFFSMVFHLQSVCTSVPVYQFTSVPVYQCNPL